MKKVLVTGATGFTGGHLYKMLLRDGYDVTVLVRESSIGKLEEKFGKSVKYIIGDLSEPKSIEGKFEYFDTVYNVAALYRQEGMSEDMFFKVNRDGVKSLLDEAVRVGVKKFIHCSTVGVQGEISNPPAKEDAPYKPGDHYQRSKLEGEKLALSYFKNGKIEGVVIRPVGIYGPGDDRFLKLFKHIYNGSFKMIGKGKALYHMTFVEDLCRGIILAGEKKIKSGEIYIIGGNEYLPLDDLVKLLAKIMKKPVSKFKIPLFPVYIAAFFCEKICKTLGIEPPLFRRRLDFFTKDRAFDISKAKKELGYEPKISLDEGLKMTFDWYMENGWLKN